MQNTELYQTLVKPHVTEKSMRLIESDIYPFIVRGSKKQIAKAVTEVYKVDVVAVRTLNYKPERKFTRKGLGHTKRFKLAYVRIKSGQRIDLEAPQALSGE